MGRRHDKTKQVLSYTREIMRYDKMNRGLASFEFLITLGLILLITSVLITSSLAQSKDTMTLSTAKTLVTEKIASKEIENQNCLNPKIESYKVQSNTLIFNVTPEPCKPGEEEIANEIEKEICGATPDNNTQITCGGRTYEVNIK